MSQANLAEHLARELGKEKIDPTTITRIERGQRSVSVDEAAAFARIFGVSIEDLLNDDSPENRLLTVRLEIPQIERRLEELRYCRAVLMNSAESVRAPLFDPQFLEEDVRNLLSKNDLEEVRQVLLKVWDVLNDHSWPWPVRIVEKDDGKVDEVKPANLDGSSRELHERPA